MLKHRNFAGPNGQRGAYLIAALFSLSIFAAIILGYLRYEERRHVISVSAVEGEALGQMALGIRGFIAQAQANPSIIPAGAQAGVFWLRPPACGGLPSNPQAGHVPCTYSGGAFASRYQTSFSRNTATNEITVRTSFVVPPIGGSRDAGTTNNNAIMVAERVVQTALAQQANPNNGAFFRAFANVAETHDGPHTASDGPPGVNSGRVTLVLNNAPSQDIFLRTDGTNQMLANLNMGGMSIASAQDARFLGTVQIDDGMVVTSGVAEFRDGLMAGDAFFSNINGGRWASQGVYDIEVRQETGPFTVTKPNCSAAGSNPGVYVALQHTGGINDNGYVADSITGIATDVVDQGGNWLVSPRMEGIAMNLAQDAEGGIFIDKQRVQNIVPRNARFVVIKRCR